MDSERQSCSPELSCEDKGQIYGGLRLDKIFDKISEQVSSFPCQRKRISVDVVNIVETWNVPTSTPVPSKAETEGVNYLIYLPDELLEMILGEVKSPEDLLSCSRTFRKFGNVLEPTKSVWLFPVVLPHIFDYLKKNDVLKLRQVCHGWKGTVDTYLQTSATHVDPGASMQPYKTMLPHTVHWQDDLVLDFHNDFELSEDFSRFTEKMGGRRPFDNPFVGRNVSMIGPMVANQEFWKDAVNFLEKFGEHIWELSLHLFEADIQDAVNGTGFIKMLPHCLLRLPNLRKLEICGDFNRSVWNDNIDAIRELIQQQPVPASPHLISIYIDHLDDLNEGYILFPKSYWQHVQQLFIKSSEFDCVIQVNTLRETGLENLTKLMMRVDAPWKDLSKLELLRSPLKNLKIAFNTLWIDITKLLRVLQHFGQTLEQVQVEWPEHYVSERNPELQSEYQYFCKTLDLPNLRILELWDPLDSLNFLLRLGNIERISIVSIREKKFARHKYFNKRRLMDGEKINIYGFMDRMYESNIWTLLPSLQNFKFRLQKEFKRKGDHGWTWKWRTHEFTRQHYNELRKQT